MKKEKRIQKTKEQIVEENRLKAEVNRLRPIAKEVIFKALNEGAKSLTHAQRTCEILKSVMQSKMNQSWVDKNVGDLDLVKELTGDEKMTDREMYLSLLTGFTDIKIVDAMKLLDGMGGSIDGFIKKEASKKPFIDVKVEDLIG